MTGLQIFNYESHQVRSVIKDGAPYFVAADVCRILDQPNISQVVARLDDDEKGIHNLDTLGGKQVVTVISESGLYNVILTSRKPEARQFKRWVTHEVLPAIRKTGRYEAPRDADEQALLLATEVTRLIAEKRQLQTTLSEAAPKIAFYDQVADCKDAISIGSVAKVLNIPSLGQNKLFKFLRDRKVLRSNNLPYQEYIDRGWFRVIEREWKDNQNNSHIHLQTLVYQKGIDGIRRLWAH